MTTATADLSRLSRWPIMVAPMAGGPSTVELVLAAAAAGAFGFLAAGYKSAEAMVAEMAAVRAATDRPFGVNVFVPGAPTSDATGLAAYVESVQADAAALGATAGLALWDDDDYQAKLEALLAQPPAVISFTFGCPSRNIVTGLRVGGAMVVATVTTPEEAQTALNLGVDALCLQGCEAGAHRGHFGNDDRPDQDRPLYGLLAAMSRRTRVPLIAAGGLMTAADVRIALASGARAVQLGTAFLRCPESGAHAVYKEALGQPRFAHGAITRAYSGRRARSLVTRFMVEHPHAPAAYPEVNNMTRPLRAAAAAAGDPDHMSLYAGTGAALARSEPVAEVVQQLVSGLPS